VNVWEKSKHPNDGAQRARLTRRFRTVVELTRMFLSDANHFDVR
jgi:hypothetical protein